MFSILSYNELSELQMFGRDLIGVLDYFSNQILLPLGGLLIAVFAGWAMHSDATRDELSSLTANTYALWHFLIRFVVPPALLVIFVMGVSE